MEKQNNFNLLEIDNDFTNLSRVKDFFSGRSVFVTGFSGFVGKIFVEKLLWMCPDIEKIYVLIRPKKNLSTSQRLSKIFNLDMFDRLRERDGDSFKDKIEPVEGDLLQPDLGLSEKDRNKITTEVSIVIHMAATIRFDEYITKAVDINIRGTKFVLDLSLSIKNLDVFTYISTAYTNCDRLVVEEEIYNPKADWRTLLEVNQKVDEASFNILGNKCNRSLPNTYVFTKSIAEHVVKDYRDRLPVVIVRPSIVTSCMIEPICGYLDNLNGPNGFFLGTGTGTMRTFIAHKKVHINFVPPDFLARFILLVTMLKPHQKKGSVPVYHITSDKSYTINNVDYFLDLMKTVLKQYPLKIMLWKPVVHTVETKKMFYVNFYLFQLLPALFVDLLLKTFGQKPVLVDVQKKMFMTLLNYSFFLTNEIDFKNTKVFAVNQCIHSDDMKEMYFTFKDTEINYMYPSIRLHLYGAKRFLKQLPEDLAIAKKRLKILTIADAIVKNVVYLLTAWYIYENEILQTAGRYLYNFALNY